MSSSDKSATSVSTMKSKHALDGITAKLEWAEESIQTLNAEINEFLTCDPRPYVIERGFYDNPFKYVFKAYARASIPLRIPVIAGAIVHQLRSCFDHLIVALAEANGQRPLKTHQFPICRNQEKFKKACRSGQVKGLSDSAIRRVLEAQPYHNTTSDDATLSVIHQLDIIDKHRLLLVVEQISKVGDKIEVGSESSTVRITGMSPPIAHVISEKSVDVFSIDLEQPVADFHADADFDTKIALAQVGSGLVVPIIPLLNRMSDFTRDLVWSFSDEF